MVILCVKHFAQTIAQIFQRYPCFRYPSNSDETPDQGEEDHQLPDAIMKPRPAMKKRNITARRV